MAIITDRDTLTTAVQDYLARSDLAGFVPNFIQNAENKLYRTLRIKAMEYALSFTISSGTGTVPTDYLELKFANVNVSPIVSLERVSPEEIYARWPVRSGSNIPTAIARSGDTFIFGPNPGDYAVTGIYYRRLPSLSSSNTTNWFTSYAPELLLYGALLEAQPFVMNDKRIGVWQQFYMEAMRSVQDFETSENHSGSSLAVKVG